MATVTGKIIVTIDLPSATNPTVEERTFTFEDEDSVTGECDLVFVSAADGGPTMRPSKPRF